MDVRIYPLKAFASRILTDNVININLTTVPFMPLRCDKPIEWSVDTLSKTFETTSCLRYLAMHTMTLKDSKSDEGRIHWKNYIEALYSVDEEMLVQAHKRYVKKLKVIVQTADNSTVKDMIKQFATNSTIYKYMIDAYKKLIKNRPNIGIIFYIPHDIPFGAANYYQTLIEIILEDLNVTKNNVRNNDLHEHQLACAEKESGKT